MPEPKSLCLCGSGGRYQNCCKGRLPGTKNGEKWKKAAEEKRWTEMIRHLRADVTQYTIWHLSHTAPAVARRPELRHAYLMNIDIEALSECIESLMWGYARKGWLDRLPSTLDRLKSNIDDPRWLAKMTYQRAVCALWQNDREQAVREIKILQPVTPALADVDILQMHIDLHGARMGMTERIAFFDRIAASQRVALTSCNMAEPKHSKLSLPKTMMVLVPSLTKSFRLRVRWRSTARLAQCRRSGFVEF